ncbi:hypothetical protein RM553_13530 [Zunongwangia sp. F363]|uniref:Uncharacterized protein n=1 Tax=Autumnicola tepida TaxID=3075595 RepID=A0ABU3CBZ2_9FLAO|nr:hypothetical protein [Zunongwangia sp. F363]MDT0643854.1 hypothetical protein [Zunongwangia sp. F363]
MRVAVKLKGEKGQAALDQVRVWTKITCSAKQVNKSGRNPEPKNKAERISR